MSRSHPWTAALVIVAALSLSACTPVAPSLRVAQDLPPEGELADARALLAAYGESTAARAQPGRLSAAEESLACWAEGVIGEAGAPGHEEAAACREDFFALVAPDAGSLKALAAVPEGAGQPGGASPYAH